MSPTLWASAKTRFYLGDAVTPQKVKDLTYTRLAWAPTVPLLDSLFPTSISYSPLKTFVIPHFYVGIVKASTFEYLNTRDIVSTRYFNKILNPLRRLHISNKIDKNKRLQKKKGFSSHFPSQPLPQIESPSYDTLEIWKPLVEPF